ncbi:hypothetical protein, partial [Actinomadura keratinilytica]|uniref:hypothetical protein n=2 Tax=Actinomadura keratinilytica TaxID=547461 RepID=UPI0031F1AAB4
FKIIQPCRRHQRPWSVQLDERAEYQPFPWLCEGLTSISLAATVEDASELWEWDVDPIRRGLLGALPFMPTVLSEWLLSYAFDPGPESRAHAGSSGRAVGLSDVQRLRDAYEAFSEMDHRYGGGLVRPAVVGFLNDQVKPLLNGTYTDEVGSQLMTAASTLTHLAAWEAYDMNMHGLAQAHYGQSLRLAKAADDRLTASWTLKWMAQQAIDLKRPDEAVRLARAAQKTIGRTTPRVRAFLLLREARATALGVELAETPNRHDIRRVHRLLRETEEAFAKAEDGHEEPPWAAFDYDYAELSAEAGYVWLMIGEHQRARANAEIALEHFDAASYARSRQLNLIHRGEALLGEGELDEAITSVRQAVPVVATLSSARLVTRVRNFDQSLTRYAKEPAVKEWRDYLRSVSFATT